MENAKKTTLSDGNFAVYIWFWGGLITSFTSNWFGDFLKIIFSNENGMVYMAIMLIFDVIILCLMIKYIVAWLRNKYEMGDKKKLFKLTFETFMVWSLLGIGLAYWGSSAAEKANTSFLVFSVLGYVVQLIALYITLNRYLRIKYY